MTETNEKRFYKQVFALVVPIALQNLINVAVQSADVLMLGRVGEEVLSAASLAGQVNFVLTLLFFGISSGAAVLTAQYWGKHDTRAIEKVLSIALRFSLVAGVAFAVAALAVPEVLMRIFTPHPVLIAEGAKYLRIVAPTYVTMSFTMIYLQAMRSVERVHISTVVFSISLVTNVIANAIFIFGLLGAPAMGIQGAALGTLIARAVELVIVVGYAVKNSTIRLRAADFVRSHKVLLADFWHFSLPTIANEVLWGLGISTAAGIIGHLGPSAVAASSVSQVVRQLATVVCFGIAAATAIILGKTLGAGEIEKAAAYSKRLVKLAVLTGAGGSVLVLLVRPLVLGVMTLTPQAQDYLRFLLLVNCVLLPAMAFNCTMIVGVFRSGGDTRVGFFIDVFGLWCFAILLGFLAAFVFRWPVYVVYVILLSDEIVKIPMCIWRYRQGVWLKNVTRGMGGTA